ncbi:MAG TPA: Maf family protein [Caulobacteraceae bacterium]|jgi:septum formation protein
MRLVLASTSAARRAMLASAGLSFEAAAPGTDEEAAKARLLAKGASPLKVAEMLAAMKAVEVSEREPGLVIGADQTLDLDGELIGKAHDLEEARYRLYQLRGRSHRLHSAVVAAEAGQPVWRASDSATLSVRVFSEDFLDGYLERNGERLLGSVGCYQLEGEGAQLFDTVEGDYFTILGMPLLPLLGFLRKRGVLPE